ncbi:M48 family metalloprotease [Danxiaibacter flavus]|uniref:M48 family metalloprotease n=1 Tax=Danxiaibacter flavus TaxID=3049108 RepID=A0ABV3Z9J9_9BACT|nr:M48 family metalloprotease [Chitinophagaceae bacterium DXS]
MEPNTYPAAPSDIPENLIVPNHSFKKNVGIVVASIVAFFFLYLILLALGILVGFCFAFAGGFILINIHNIWFILLGIGLMGVGLMICFFLVKFLFATKKEDHGDKIEATERDYPELFAFVRNVSKEVGTSFPKHIYFTQEVNAFVSYDSSFKSLFFPVRKNLTIGIGLVNMLNLSEFKAVLAHEFGHFSQKSMKAGSYVYQVNKVIYNMLYENNSYSAVLQSWANIHQTFAACAAITVKVVQCIQWILQRAYKVINKNYLGLSREMEFHADAISAKVSGSNNAIHALRRIDFADACYNFVIDKYNGWLKENRRGKNAYTQQQLVATALAKESLLPVKNSLPVFDDAATNVYQKFNRVVINNQWASHPTRHQREDALKKLNIIGTVVDTPATGLFRNLSKLEETMTDLIYRNVTFEQPDDLQIGCDVTFQQELKLAREKYNYNEAYNGYYNHRNIEEFDPAQIKPVSFTDIYAYMRENKDLNNKTAAMEEDIAALKFVEDKTSGIRNFDFDGNKYSRDDATMIRNDLEKSLKQLKNAQVFADETVYHYYHQKAFRLNPANSAWLQNCYAQYFTALRLSLDNLVFFNEMVTLLDAFRQDNTKAQAIELATNMKTKFEQFKLKVLHATKVLKSIDNLNILPIPVALNALQDMHYEYIGANSFNTSALQATVEFYNLFADWNYNMRMEAQKDLLDKQLQLSETAVAITATIPI